MVLWLCLCLYCGLLLVSWFGSLLRWVLWSACCLFGLVLDWFAWRVAWFRFSFAGFYCLCYCTLLCSNFGLDLMWVVIGLPVWVWVVLRCLLVFLLVCGWLLLVIFGFLVVVV